ncbi:hypothetical protein Pla108_07330 [Botrimarina colliarenosi]|uniref:Uncharacterized protein n=1 Tax=Botrimarina colliarenosi TaxID=2528001 RepID=A0A5C6AK50_9BACT|nr:hypothetical protein [Botrimarina colliarenosi]TWT99790.1 hypothetical protein Pla108_07330 [Botrimarina colliarenosi]
MQTNNHRSIVPFDQWRTWRDRQTLKHEQQRSISPTIVHGLTSHERALLRPGCTRIQVDLPVVTGFKVHFPEGPICQAVESLPEFNLHYELTPERGAVGSLAADGDTASEIAAVARQLTERLPFVSRAEGFDWDIELNDEPALRRTLEEWIRTRVRLVASQRFSDLLLPPIREKVCRQLIDAFGTVSVVLDSQRPMATVVAFPNGRITVTPSLIGWDDVDGADLLSAVNATCFEDAHVLAMAPCRRVGLTIPSTPAPPGWIYRPSMLIVVANRKDINDPLHLLVEEGLGDDVDHITSVVRRYWVRGVNRHGGFGTWGFLPLFGDLTSRGNQLRRFLEEFNRAESPWDDVAAIE